MKRNTHHKRKIVPMFLAALAGLFSSPEATAPTRQRTELSRQQRAAADRAKRAVGTGTYSIAKNTVSQAKRRKYARQQGVKV